MMRLCGYACIAVFLGSTPALAESSEKQKAEPWKPCTARSSTSGNFFDINSLQASDKLKKEKDSLKVTKPTSWHARGYDYGANFTLNFCGPVVEDLEKLGGVEDLSSRAYQNVSAYYSKDGKIYSLGQESNQPVVRGRKLVLNFTDGSYCPSSSRRHKRASLPITTEESLAARAEDDDDEKDDDEEDGGDRSDSDRESRPRKSTIISMLCERTPKAGDAAVVLSFVGTTDECTYSFEARSPAACPTTTPQQALGPGGVFSVIGLITGLVYLIGGIMYQRIVQQQRGWRQIPNYGFWSGIFGFLSDVFVIFASSCARCIPGLGRVGRKGYSRVPVNGNGSVGGRRGRSDSDDENRLIDQLDEEWDD